MGIIAGILMLIFYGITSKIDEERKYREFLEIQRRYLIWENTYFKEYKESVLGKGKEDNK